MKSLQKKIFRIYPKLALTLAATLLIILPSHLQAAELQANLIQSIDTSNFPAPDTSGIIYLPTQDAFLVVDSEVSEMTIFQGVNVFKVDLNGGLLDTFSTTSFSEEPTGITINPQNNHCFISDDDQREIFEIDPGSDGLCLTPDDSVTSFDTRNNFGSNDPEDLTYGLNSLFIVDGVTNTVYRIMPGPNGVFDSVLTGDDLVSSFDTAGLGVPDPEGIAFDSRTNSLFIVGSQRDLIIQTTIDGLLLNTVDLAAINPNRPAGLALAPSSENQSITNLYMVVRGVDNDDDPNENDGMIYELEIPGLITPGNQTPVVWAGEDQSITLPNNALLNGSVSDDGIPNGTLNTTWIKYSGPGEVNFTDVNNPNTSASFATAGTYVFRLSGSDGELYDFDDLSIVVSNGTSQISVVQSRVSASADDAEERPDGSIYLDSSDLELVFDYDLQTVGMRFTNLIVPENAVITKAYIQFKVDETDFLLDTQLNVAGEKGSNAATFSNQTYNISSRSKTTASVSWSPAAWIAAGIAGEEQRSADLTAIVQEIISETGWSSGNAMAFIFTGVGTRVAEAYDGDQAGAPLLYLEYTTDASAIPPLLTINGANPMILNLGDTFTDPGATAIDNIDGDISAFIETVSDVDTSVAATYAVTYSISDSDGNSASAERSVIVNNDTDSIAPVITLIGANPMTFNLGVTFTDPGATAVDDVDGDLSAFIETVSDVDTAIAGTYQVAYSVSDLSGNSASATRSVIVSNGTSQVSVVQSRVSASADDAEERPDGSMYLDSSDLELVFDHDLQTVGMRFTNLTVPENAVITKAYIQFKVDETDSLLDTQLNIVGEKGSNAATFINQVYNISSRSKTTASVAWSPAAWSAVGLAGEEQRSADLTAIVQEIVSETGWSSGNAMAFIFNGSGTRVAEAYDGDQAGAPLLYLEYTTDVSAIAPVITLAGTNPMILNLGDTFTDPGATAIDNIDGDLTAFIETVSDVDTSVAATYTVIYSVSDSDGNSASATRNVIVSDNTVAPVLTLIGANPITLTIGETFTDPGATAIDTIDGDLSAFIETVSDVDTSVAATYTVIYSISDSDGNSASATRDVIVSDNTVGPVLTLIGANPINLTIGETFTDPGATAIDYLDGDITTSIETISNVNIDVAATYLITYTVSDSDGNSASVLRSVIVSDPGSPPTVRNVPSDYPTIADAINSAVEGDTIVLSPGTYDVNSTLYIDKNNITITSRYLTSGDENDIDTTIIKGDPTVRLIDGVLGQSANFKLIGLTITDALKGVTFTDDYGEVHYCKFYNTQADAISFDTDAGGAVTHTRVENSGDDAIDIDTRYNGSFLIAYNELINSNDDSIEIHLYNSVSALNMHYDIHDNLFSGAGEDGIQLIDYDQDSKRTFDIYRNIFQGMPDVAISSMFEATAENFQGTAMTERVRIYNNYFYNNGYHITGGDNMIILNNIFEAAGTTAIKRVKTDSITDHNLFYNNPVDTEDTLTGSNNLYGNPQRNSEFTLQAGSPAIDAGTSSYTHLAELVLQIPSTEYAGANQDMGRYEYAVNSTAPVITLIGANPINLNLGEAFTDPGATAVDDVDGDLSASIATVSDVDTDIAGAYLVTYTVTDSDGNSTSLTRSVIVSDGTSQVSILQSRVSASADDAEEYPDGSMYLNSSDLELVFDHDLQTVGMRFTNLTVPINAVITKAYIQFKVDETDSLLDTQLNIVGEKVSNAATFINQTYNISSRSKTSASVAWSPAAWSAVGLAGEEQRSADLTAIVQEIVSETGWSSGNAMAFIFTGTGTRVAEAYDGDQVGAPLLYLEYTTDTSAIAPVITLIGANPINLNIGETFTDPGATAIDNVDGDLTASIETISNVDIAISGTYQVTYTVTDSDGNNASVTRNVVVSDPAVNPNIVNIPGDYPTIADALANAVEGNIILLAPGIYNENELDITTNDITIASLYLTTGDQSYIDNTIIQGDPQTYFITGVREQSRNLRIIGLTIRDSLKAITFHDANGEVHYCKIYDTGSAEYSGEHDAIGFDKYAGGGTVTNCLIDNSRDDGIDIDAEYNSGEFVIANNIITNSQDDGMEIRLFPQDNVTILYDIHDNLWSGSQEDGIQLIDYDGNNAAARTFNIYRNTFINNVDVGLGTMENGNTIENFNGTSMAERINLHNNYFYNNGYHITGGDNMIILNNIFEAAGIAAIKRANTASITDHNLFYNNPVDTEDTLTGSNNLDTNPQRNSDFTLQPGSPAIDAGTSSYTHLAELVLQIPATEYIGSNPDMGRYEYDLNNIGPVITLIGANPINLNIGETFTDPGATAVDDVDGDLSASIATVSDVDTAIAGAYLVTYTVTDSDGNSTALTRSVIVSDGTSQVSILQSRVSASADDAEEHPDGSMYLNSSDLELVFDHDLQTVGMRFTNLTVPINAVITKAYIQFKVDETDSLLDTQLNIVGEKVSNSATFINQTYNISSRSKTSASVAWSPAAWSAVGLAGEEQRSADLTAIVQEIVSETGWSSGNAMAFIFTGAGTRVAEAYDGDQVGAPLLYVEYTY